MNSPSSHDHHHSAGAAPVEAADGRVITNPVRYTDDAPQQVEVTAPAAVAQPSGTHATVYTCPMHPQIRQPGPGTCPICGMALVPVMIVGAVCVLGYTDLLARIGWGEIAAGLGLGGLPVIGTALVQDGTLGQAAVAAAVPAALMAIYNATGKWIIDLPITPDKILQAMGKVR